MEKVSDDQLHVKRYRGYAVYGGLFAGAVTAAVGLAPHLKSSFSSIGFFCAVLLGCALAGALIGYLFIEVFMAREIAGGHWGHGISADDVSSSHSVGDTGGTDGGCGDATD
jgi:hypothetical protein